MDATLVFAAIFHTTLLGRSLTKIFPDASTAIPTGCPKSAGRAGPPTPYKPEVPFPATVVTAGEDDVMEYVADVTLLASDPGATAIALSVTWPVMLMGRLYPL